MLTQLWQAPSMVATVKVSMPKGVGNNKAVLAVIGQKYGYIAMTDEGRVEFCQGNFKTDSIEWKVTDKCIGTTETYLRLEVISCTNSKEAKCRVSYSIDGVDFIDVYKRQHTVLRRTIPRKSSRAYRRITTATQW